MDLREDTRVRGPRPGQTVRDAGKRLQFRSGRRKGDQFCAASAFSRGGRSQAPDSWFRGHLESYRPENDRLGDERGSGGPVGRSSRAEAVFLRLVWAAGEQGLSLSGKVFSASECHLGG